MATPSLSTPQRSADRPLASRQEVADYLGMSVQTLAVWAMKGVGPRYRKCGRHCRYEWSDVYAWLDAQAQFGGAA